MNRLHFPGTNKYKLFGYSKFKRPKLAARTQGATAVVASRKCTGMLRLALSISVRDFMAVEWSMVELQVIVKVAQPRPNHACFSAYPLSASGGASNTVLTETSSQAHCRVQCRSRHLSVCNTV